MAHRILRSNRQRSIGVILKIFTVKYKDAWRDWWEIQAWKTGEDELTDTYSYVIIKEHTEIHHGYVEIHRGEQVYPLDVIKDFASDIAKLTTDMAYCIGEFS